MKQYHPAQVGRTLPCAGQIQIWRTKTNHHALAAVPYTDSSHEQIFALARAVRYLAEHQQRMNEITLALLARLGDPTHLTVREVANIRGVSEKTIRREIERGELELEAVPGTRGGGVRIERVYDRWIPLRTLRAARLREKDLFEKLVS